MRNYFILFFMKIGDRTSSGVYTLVVVQESQQVVDGNFHLSLSGHLRGHGGDGLNNSRSERTAVIFKEQHPGTEWFEDHGQKDHW